ncbi:MAG: UDP-3-O-(3-hydroxymyristoyl)glucosamine N-acyltransferase [Cyanobacteria bacterium PR.3.49]|jgi:UDP-3-O-[3-hydroxymyristoyl] glucosamine N-acyltransferase|nr:UDP-3-O-(3-hydroxymyristoyl)glucosamine N-acyltransferase [Cyanobacteria bacterium PR.3.49]
MKLPAEMSLAQIAHVIGGRVEGPADLINSIKVSSVAVSPLHATEDDLALVFDEKLIAQLPDCKAKALVVTPKAKTERPRIVVERPMAAIQKMLSAVAPKPHTPPIGVHPSAVVDPTAELGEGVAVGPLVVIGPGCKIGAKTVIQPGTVIGAKVEIGENCLIGAGCLIADVTKIGNRVILQQGAVLGSDGFGYATERESNLERRLRGNRELEEESNPHLKIPHIGTVIIEDDVEIGSCTTIDRSTMGATTIGQGTKIDNLVMIAHNCRIGKEVLIIGTTAIGGSCTIDDRAIISGSACISDHIKIGKDSIVEGMSGVMGNVPPAEIHAGIPATERRQQIEQVIRVKKLKSTFADIKDMKERLARLEALLAETALVKK